MWQLFGQKVPYFPQMYWNQSDSSSFKSLFMGNTEPLEPNLNGVFANKYSKKWYWLRNYNSLRPRIVE